MLNDVAGSSPALLDGTNWTILEPRDSSLAPRVERIQSPAASLTEPDEIRRRSARACHRGTRAQKESSSPGTQTGGHRQVRRARQSASVPSGAARPSGPGALGAALLGSATITSPLPPQRVQR